MSNADLTQQQGSGQYSQQQPQQPPTAAGQFPQFVIQTPNSDPWSRAIGKAVDWLFSQTSNVVSNYLILIVLLVGGWYFIPVHIKQIHQGYDDINDKNNKRNDECMKLLKEMDEKARESRKEMTDKFSATVIELTNRHSEDTKKAVEAFDKAADRMERSFTEGFKAAGKKD